MTWKAVEFAFISKTFYFLCNLVGVLFSGVPSWITGVTTHINFILVLDDLAGCVCFAVYLQGSTIISNNVVGGVLHKSKVVVVAIQGWVVGWDLLDTVATNCPTVVEPPLGKVAVAVFVFQSVAHVTLNKVCASVCFLPAHWDGVVEVLATAHFEEALLLNCVVAKSQVGFGVATIVLATSIEGIKALFVNAQNCDTSTLEECFVVVENGWADIFWNTVVTAVWSVCQTCCCVVLVAYGNVTPHVFYVVDVTFFNKVGNVVQVAKFGIFFVTRVAYVEYVGGFATLQCQAQSVAIGIACFGNHFYVDFALVLVVESLYNFAEYAQFYVVAVSPKYYCCAFVVIISATGSQDECTKKQKYHHKANERFSFHTFLQRICIGTDVFAPVH